MHLELQKKRVFCKNEANPIFSLPDMIRLVFIVIFYSFNSHKIVLIIMYYYKLDS